MSLVRAIGGNARHEAGRPALSELDRWPRQAWTQSVIVASGVRLHELEKRYGAVSSRSGRFSRVWYKYRDGVRPIPEWLFQQVANDYLETKKWLSHPLWRLLKPKVALSQVYDAMLELPTEVVKLLFRPQNENRNGRALRGPRSGATLPLLYLAGKWRGVECSDRYAVCLGLMREAEILLDQESHSVSKNFLEGELETLAQHPVVGFLAAGIHRKAMELFQGVQDGETPMRAMYEWEAEEKAMLEAANLRSKERERQYSGRLRESLLKGTKKRSASPG